jgi:Trk K+ transport system NAD-binding subunit
MEEDVVCLTKNDPLSKSVEKMSASQLNLIPVVEKSGSKKPIGYITRKDILTIYEKEILKKNISGIKFKSIVSDIHKFEQEEQQSIDFTQDYAIKTLNVPKDFWGKTLADSMLRQRYGVTVLAVRDSNRKEHIIPGPDYILKSDDKIVIAINKKDLDKLPS